MQCSGEWQGPGLRLKLVQCSAFWCTLEDKHSAQQIQRRLKQLQENVYHLQIRICINVQSERGPLVQSGLLCTAPGRSSILHFMLRLFHLYIVQRCIFCNWNYVGLCTRILFYTTWNFYQKCTLHKIERHLCTKYYSYNSFYFVKVSCRTQGAMDKGASLHKILFKSFKEYYSEDILNFVKVRPSLHSAECSGQMASSFLTGRRCTSLFRKCTQTLGLIIPIIIQPNIYLTFVI